MTALNALSVLAKPPIKAPDPHTNLVKRFGLFGAAQALLVILWLLPSAGLVITLAAFALLVVFSLTYWQWMGHLTIKS